MYFPFFQNSPLTGSFSLMFVTLPRLVLFVVTLYINLAFALDESEPAGSFSSFLESDEDHHQAVLKAVVAQLARNEEHEQAGNNTQNTDVVESSDEAPLGGDIAAATDNTLKDEAVDKARVKSRNREGAKKSKKRLRKQFTKDEMLTADFIMNVRFNDDKMNRNLGWVYLGRFASKGWFNKTLDIKGSLPRVGKSYTVMQSLNLRSEPPARQGIAQIIKNLKAKQKVEVDRIKTINMR